MIDKLHIGCGTNYLEGFVNVDIDPQVKSDWCGNALHMPKIWHDRFSMIYSHHSLEHFPNLFLIVDEMARVSCDGAIWDITVPYWSWPQNAGNPYHLINFSEHTFKFFDRTTANGIYKRGREQTYSLEEISTEWDAAQIHYKMILRKCI